METFTEPRELVLHDGYASARRAAADAFDLSDVDAPIVDVVKAFGLLPYCFTLQCCYGHFLTEHGRDDHSLALIPESFTGVVRYRLAYVAFCIENGDRGRGFLEKLSRIAEIEPAYMQFGSADWFWDQWPNSYVLQVEPFEHRFKDQATIQAAEARMTQRVRDQFFHELRRLLAEETTRQPSRG